jgi:hypothetical protein
MTASYPCGSTFARRKQGTCLPGWSKFVCSAMIVILPTSLIAQDSSRAMLHSNGGVWLNGNPAHNSSAIFLHDLVQTQKESRAEISTNGSGATIESDTIVQFEGDELVLEHGSLQLNTSRGMRVRVNCLTVIPLTQEWTRYDVIALDGRITVATYKNDIKIHYQGAAVRRSKLAYSDVTVHPGQQVTREERCRADAKPAGALDANGAILNSPWARGAGIAAIGILTCWALCRGDEPVSPSKP